MSFPLEYVQVETSDLVDGVVIWLHGLGADGYDFQPIVESLNLPSDMGIRFIFPHAPIRPVTINGGMKMRAWYDILEMTLNRKVDMANIDESCKSVLEIIEQQMALGISSERILLAGFSQGGVIAYQLGLNAPYKLAGIMALSTYLASDETVRSSQSQINGITPILIHHGDLDPVVVPELGENALNTLQEQGYAVDYKTYSMAHAVCPEQIQDISLWLQSRLG